MRIKAIFVSVLFTTLMISVTVAPADGEVYRWVDENGVVHFGDDPKGNKSAEVVDLEVDETSGLGADSAPGSTDPGLTNAGEEGEPQPSLAQQRRDERAAQRQEAAERQAAVDKICERARQRVAQLEPSPQVLVQTEDGTVERLDDNKRLELLAESKSYIAGNCEK